MALAPHHWMAGLEGQGLSCPALPAVTGATHLGVLGRGSGRAKGSGGVRCQGRGWQRVGLVVDCRVHTTSCQVSFPPSLGFTDHTRGLLSLPSWSRCGDLASLQRALYTVKGSKNGELFYHRPQAGPSFLSSSAAKVGVPGCPPQENLSQLRLTASSIPVPISSWGSSLGEEACPSSGLGGEHSGGLKGLQPRRLLWNLRFAISWLG